MIALALLVACGATGPAAADPPAAPVTPPAAAAPSEAAALRTGQWRAWLDSPGGQLPFGIDVSEGNGRWQAWVLNGTARTEIADVAVTGTTLHLGLADGTAIDAEFPDSGDRLAGTWRQADGDATRDLPFHAHWGRARRFHQLRFVGDPAPVAGTWVVSLTDPPGEGTLELTQSDDGATVIGTLTLPTAGALADLEGTIEGVVLRLSHVSGTQAALVDAKVAEDGTLAGDLWRGADLRLSFTARRP